MPMRVLTRSRPHPRRRRRGITAVLAAAALGVVGLAAPAAHASGGGGGESYVAMGDSYSAASGVLPLDSRASLLCIRSSANYPHVLAARAGLDLTDVTCGAAQTKDFAGAQYPGVVGPQLDALGSGTDLVTMTIGGNDSNTFIDAILACGSAGVATLGFGHPCRSLYGSTFTDQVDTGTYQAVKAALQAVHAKAPHARVAVLGYPWIVPAAAVPGCFVRLPIASGDVPYLRDLQAHLNAAVQRAADETGSTFVDMAAASNGHDACQPSGVRWIEPVLFGTNFVPVHPNALGESRMADRAAAVLGLG